VRCTYWFKSGNLCCVIVWRYVIHGRTTIGTIQVLIRDLWHALESSVRRAVVHNSRPIVREILAEGASGTASGGGYVVGRIHRGIERVLAALEGRVSNRGNKTHPSYDLNVTVRETLNRSMGESIPDVYVETDSRLG
jgi:hypothetical protein